MKITLSQAEVGQIIQQAVVDYVARIVIVPVGSDVQVTVGADGGAEVEISAAIVAAPAAIPAKRSTQAKRATPAKAAVQPKAEPAAPVSPTVQPTPAPAAAEQAP